jgi:hypothetical protein
MAAKNQNRFFLMIDEISATIDSIKTILADNYFIKVTLL